MTRPLEDLKLQQQIAHLMTSHPAFKYHDDCDEMDAGYTYLGQFVSHELVPPTNLNRQTRTVTTAMDLGSLYGERLDGEGDDNRFDSKGRFVFAPGEALDFRRNAEGVALIPESRNDDHVLIAHMHLFWQRLHNKLIDEGLAADKEEAQRLVTLTVQLVVVEDFLRMVLDDNAYRGLFGRKPFWPDEDALPWLDIFRFGTYRFGHSLVRGSYKLVKHTDVRHASKTMSELFLGHRQPRVMGVDDEVDWRALFCQRDDHGCRATHFEGAMPIDTRISVDMSKIDHHDDLKHHIHIVLANIGSELKAELPTGLAVATKLKALLPPKLAKDCPLLNNDDIQHAAFSAANPDIEDLTIWLYALLEAQLHAIPHQLGWMASWVNGTFIARAIDKAPVSIFDDGYDVDAVLAGMGPWGEMLQQWRSEDGAAVRMQDLAVYIEQEK